MRDLLLIEDDSDLRKVIREAVEIEGYQVTLAFDAEEALTLLAKGYTPAGIMCDITLPRMSGLDLLSELRQNPAWSRVVIIAMSGTEKMKQEALDAGADYFLIKPFSFHELFDVLTHINPSET
jgi:two-component system, OmpR family, KDP operon response regulator KdpE